MEKFITAKSGQNHHQPDLEMNDEDFFAVQTITYKPTYDRQEPQVLYFYLIMLDLNLIFVAIFRTVPIYH